MMTLSVSTSISRISRMKIVLFSANLNTLWLNDDVECFRLTFTHCGLIMTLSVSESISRIARMKIVLLSTNLSALWSNDDVECFQVDLEDIPDEDCVIID